MSPRWSALGIAAAACLASQAAIAAAQGGDGMGFGDEPAPGDGAPGDAAQPAPDDAAFLEGEEKQTEEQRILAAPADERGGGRAEDPNDKLFLLGARLRWIMIPMWFIDMFGVDSMTRDGRHMLVNRVGVGPEFTYRKDGLDITAAIWWVDLRWKGYTAFKESGEEANSWEVVTNDLSTILFSVDFVWSTSFTDWFAITYGVGIGIGIPIAPDNVPFVRTESASPDPLTPCTQDQMSNDDNTDWCNSNEQYKEAYKLPTGIVPWINLLGGLRFKPHRHVALYADFGFGVGFQTGIRGGYVF